MTRIGALFGLALFMVTGPACAETIDLSCNNGIVTVPLHLDTAAGSLTMEGSSFHVGFGSPKIPFSMTDLSGDKIDYVLDRAANILTETDHDRMPDGSFKVMTLQFACVKSGN
jgi:hypothetical protein